MLVANLHHTDFLLIVNESVIHVNIKQVIPRRNIAIPAEGGEIHTEVVTVFKRIGAELRRLYWQRQYIQSN